MEEEDRKVHVHEKLGRSIFYVQSLQVREIIAAFIGIFGRLPISDMSQMADSITCGLEQGRSANHAWYVKIDRPKLGYMYFEENGLCQSTFQLYILVKFDLYTQYVS